MTDCADFEIGLFRRDALNYQVVARFQLAGSNTEAEVTSGEAAIDVQALQEERGNLETYGTLLSQRLFASQAVSELFQKALRDCQTAGQNMHLRLYIEQPESELHTLLWETLRSPADGYQSWLRNSPNIYLSRYLHRSDFGPIRLHARDELRALVVVANPKDLGQFEIALDANNTVRRRLPPIDAPGEVQRAREALGSLRPERVRVVASDPGQQVYVTLDRLMEELADYKPSGVDILYLVCHGELMSYPVQGPYLWLDDEQGNARPVQAEHLARRIASLPAEQRPRVLVLASCQGAGVGHMLVREDGSALVPAAPRLVSAGIPAVIAMQGSVSMETVKQFMPAFFKDLAQDGLVDQAAARARAQVQDRPDSYMPVLFMRLRGGSIWRGAAPWQRTGDFPRMADLVTSIRNARENNRRKSVCLPVLGPGVVESMIGTRNHAAGELARLHSYPFSDQDRENFPQVAQFMTNYNSLDFTYSKYCDYLKQRLKEAEPGLYPADISAEVVDDMFRSVGCRRRAQEPAKDLHALLAGLDLPIYLTANPDSLMADALRERLAARGSQANPDQAVNEVVCNWRTEEMGGLPQEAEEALPEPSQAHPLVYYLFGKLDDPRSLVLTQDDYYDFLINVTRESWRVPSRISTAMLDSTLLLLGFPMDDWGLRLIFRYLASLKGFSRLKLHANIAVQFDPEDGRIHDPDRARKYFENYFQSTHVVIFWGRTDEFIYELDQRVNH